MHTQADIHGDHGGANVKGSAVQMRNPCFLNTDQLLQAFQGSFLIQGGHAHALCAAGHAGEVGLGTEELQTAVSTTIAFGSFKNGLAVMENHGGRIQRKISVGYDAGVVPADTLFIVHQEHMVGKNPAETEGRLVRGFLFEIL